MDKDSKLTEAVNQTAAEADELEEQLNIITDILEQQYEETFTLQLLHVSDMDGSVWALADVENFSAILDGFRRQLPNNTLVLSSGDNYIPGPRYYAATDGAMAHVLGVPGEGRGDIAFLNAMGFQASAVGSHELDRGAGAFAAAIGSETEDGSLYPGAMFPYLSSNIVFAADEDLTDMVAPDGQEAWLAGGGLAKSAVITVGGERIGVVGATTPALKSITAASGIEVLPATEENIDGLAAIIQQEVDALVGQGIDKVILLAHMQRIDVEKELATKLVDVDIIVAGGSNTHSGRCNRPPAHRRRSRRSLSPALRVPQRRAGTPGQHRRRLPVPWPPGGRVRRTGPCAPRLHQSLRKRRLRHGHAGRPGIRRTAHPGGDQNSRVPAKRAQKPRR